MLNEYYVDLLWCDYDVSWALPIYLRIFWYDFFIFQAPVTRSALVMFYAIVIIGCDRYCSRFHRKTWFDYVQIPSFYNIHCSFMDSYSFVDIKQFLVGLSFLIAFFFLLEDNKTVETNSLANNSR